MNYILYVSNRQLTFSQLDTTWASIPVERFQHLVESMPRCIEAVLRAKGRVQLTIRKVFFMFVYWLLYTPSRYDRYSLWIYENFLFFHQNVLILQKGH